MCSYLEQVGSTYYFRRVVPDELRPFILTKTGKPRAEFKTSLRTKDRDTAKSLIPHHVIETNRAFNEARAKLARGVPQISDEIVSAPSPTQRAREQAQWEYEQEAQEFFAQENAEQEARQEARAEARRLLEERLRLSTRELAPHEAIIKDILRDKEFDLTLAQDRIGHYRRQLNEARETGRVDELWRLTRPAENKLHPSPGEGTSTSLDTVIEKWGKERKVSAKGIAAHKAVACWFHERVGTIAVEQITKRDVLSFKDKLLEEGTTVANTKVKLSRLRTLLQYAVANDVISINPGDGVTLIDNEAAKNKRREFDLAALSSIFGGPVHAKGERPKAGSGEAAHWLPLLALYTGARLNELGQLHPVDVLERTYHDGDDKEQRAWVIRITEDGDGQKLKNAGSERAVPVHPELERLGFIRFVRTAQDKKQALLFPDLKPDTFEHLTGNWSKWFSRYLRQTCKVTDKRMTFHSFRHTFKHYARHVGMTEGVQRAIMGHSSDAVADDYGSGYTLYQLVEGMELYRVPRFKLPTPSRLRAVT